MSPAKPKALPAPTLEGPPIKSLDELRSLAGETAKRNGHVLKVWGHWMNTPFDMADCTLCGAFAIVDPTFRSYESGMGGGAIQFHCRSAYLNPQPSET